MATDEQEANSTDIPIDSEPLVVLVSQPYLDPGCEN